MNDCKRGRREERRREARKILDHADSCSSLEDDIAAAEIYLHYQCMYVCECVSFCERVCDNGKSRITQHYLIGYNI